MPTNFHQKLIDLLKDDDRLRDEDGELRQYNQAYMN